MMLTSVCNETLQRETEHSVDSTAEDSAPEYGISSSPGSPLMSVVTIAGVGPE